MSGFVSHRHGAGLGQGVGAVQFRCGKLWLVLGCGEWSPWLSSSTESKEVIEVYFETWESGSSGRRELMLYTEGRSLGTPMKLLGF